MKQNILSLIKISVSTRVLLCIIRKYYKGLGVYDERTKTKNEEGKFCVSARSGQVPPPLHIQVLP